MLPSLDREKTLNQLAMEYAIASVRAEQAEGLAQLKINITEELWTAGQLRNVMEAKFGCFETQEAIKRAEEVVRMVIPDQGDDDASM